MAEFSDRGERGVTLTSVIDAAAAEVAQEDEGCPAGARGMGAVGGLAADLGRGEATAVHVKVVGEGVGAGVDAGGEDPCPNPMKPKNPPPVPIGLTSLAGVVGEVL